MARYEIDEKILNGILQYLGTQPFQAVAGLIDSIQKDIKKIEIKEDKK